MLACTYKQGRMSAARFPVEVKALGMLQHQRKKICMLSVLWSDQNYVLIYREFEEFKKLHKRLKRKFPIESGVLRRSDRSIPTFRDVKGILRTNHKLSRCTQVLKSLDIYCQELLKTHLGISRGEDVVCFFEAENRDLDPSFPENSLIILPSKMEDGRTEEPARFSRLGITQPVVGPLYRCREAFETEDVKEDPFRASKEETLEVLLKDRTGWWLVENHRKQLAWFPASYLEKTEDDPIVREANEEGTLFYLTQAYEAKRSDELSVTSGVVVEVLETLDTGWWLVRYNGRGGYVPSAFLQPYRNPHSRFLALVPNSLSASVPNLSGVPRRSDKAPPNQPRGYLDEAVRAHPFNRMMEEDREIRSRARGQTLGTTADAAPGGRATKMEKLAKSLGNWSHQEPLWAQTPEGGEAETPPSPSGSHGVSCKPSSSVRTSSLGGCPNPPVPSRPTPHEILQRCSAVTQSALRRALREASPGPCPHGGHTIAL